MLMNSMAIGKTWELLNLSGKQIWNTLIQTMPWTAGIVTGRSILVT